MKNPTLANASDLIRWSSSRESQGELPRLVRRLLLSSNVKTTRVDFRAGEAVALGGWDGIVSATEGNAFVPEGLSAWEVSAEANSFSKASSDYLKRSQNPNGIPPREATFVFVTTRRWGSKADWVRERTAEKIWRDVRVLDCDDLEAWLESTPSVHIWFSHLLGKPVEAMTPLENWWEIWCSATRPAMDTGLVIAGRDATVAAIQEWLRRGSPRSLCLKGDCADHSVAFFAATILTLPDEERERFMARAIVVEKVDALRFLVGSKDDLLLIPTFDEIDLAGEGMRNGHRVLFPIDYVVGQGGGVIQIPRPAHDAVRLELERLGFPEEESWQLASLFRRNLSAFRRQYATSGVLRRPKWTQQASAKTLIPAMLIGAWDERVEGDRFALAGLAAAEYGALARDYAALSCESDPPLRNVGGTWYLGSRSDAWGLLSGFVTTVDFERFEELAVRVFSTPDPKFDLPEENRWMASALGRVPEYSEVLRKNIAETLALIGSENYAVTADKSPGRVAGRIVARVLEGANSDWRLWASMPPRAPAFFAEAAPDIFLDRVEKGLACDDSELARALHLGSAGFSSSTIRHSIVSALEVLAWSPDFLGRSTFVLARLAHSDNCCDNARRPDQSLQEIFLPWHPRTSAPLGRRLEVLDSLWRTYPDTACVLTATMLPPKALHVSMGTSKPVYRDWVPQNDTAATYADYFATTGWAVEAMLRGSETVAARWGHLIGAIGRVSITSGEAILGRLESVDFESLSDTGRLFLTGELRRHLSAIRSHPDSKWNLPETALERVECLVQGFSPKDPILCNLWPFDKNPELPQGRLEDWATHWNQVEETRLDSAGKMVEFVGLGGIVQAAHMVEDSLALGRTLGRLANLKDPEVVGILGQYLCHADKALADLAKGFAYGRVIAAGGFEWIDDLLQNGDIVMSASQQAELLRCMACEEKTWSKARALGSEVDEAYWSGVEPWNISLESGQEYAIRSLIDVKHPHHAIYYLARACQEGCLLSAEKLMEMFELALKVGSTDGKEDTMISYHVAEILAFLEDKCVTDSSRVAAIEWAALPFLGRYERSPRVLHSELARNPDFFLEVLSMAYRAKGEAPHDLSEDEYQQASRAHELLDSWETIPGICDKGILAEDLIGWIQRARKIATEAGRKEIADQMIGKVLSSSPADGDGTWPHCAVREAIETFMSIDLEKGFRIAAINSRGGYSKRIGEGGKQERELAERYNDWAKLLGDRWVRTANLLRGIRDSYLDQASGEDVEADLESDLGI